MADDELETMKEPSKSETGTPKWVAGLSAITGAVAVLWGIAHFFLENKESKKPEAVDSRPNVSVSGLNVKGNHNVVGVEVSASSINTDGRSTGPGSASSSRSSRPK
jgi:hypothetical protein